MKPTTEKRQTAKERKRESEREGVDLKIGEHFICVAIVAVVVVVIQMNIEKLR